MPELKIPVGAKEIKCPVCGADIPIRSSVGRKRLNHAVIFICDTLRAARSVKGAAKELDCSRGYIYKVLGQHGLKPREVIDGNKTS